ncbi:MULTISPECIES: hypothetical protein [Nostoc]|uniref:Uncharacterized protein n=1 Tax=Nostoc paludosum FACHB-159 TaxID=2692908 RepID=A0ABR8KJP3_9NOSO|nr:MULTISPECIES: hypothetical protein [Nostoc]MBD2683478.1 hypothetical protein [Nostoc sp. FACHB-857]MBD2739802.1 hypothetical protein [Nostoc paludosum FACHB-159]
MNTNNDVLTDNSNIGGSPLSAFKLEQINSVIQHIPEITNSHVDCYQMLEQQP